MARLAHPVGKGAALMLAATLLVGLSQFTSIPGLNATAQAATPTSSTDTTVWSLPFDPLSPWTQDGSPTLTYVADPDNANNQVLQVTNRTNSYFGIQSPTGVLQPGQTYTATMKVRLLAGDTSTADVHFTLNSDTATGNKYAWVPGSTSITDSAWTTVSGTFTVPTDATAANTKLYIDSGGSAPFPSYLVDDLTVTTPAPTTSTAAISTGFEDGTLDGWGPTQGNASANPTVAVESTDVHSGTYAACVSDRGYSNAGLAYNATGVLTPGTTYTFSAWMRFAADQPTDTVVLSAHLPGSTVNEYPNLISNVGTVTNTGWSQVGGTFTMPNYPGDATVYFETHYNSNSAGNTSDFCIDDISFTAPNVQPNLSGVPLKSTVDFPVGVAVSQAQMEGPAGQLTAYHFDQVTAENAMKPDQWYNADGSFVTDNALADETMDFAQQNHLRVYGHNLAWYEGHQMPTWFFNVSPTDDTPLTNSAADQKILADRLQAHINFVAKYLSDGWGLFGSDTNPLVAFDVVNEAIADTATPDGLRDSRWYQVLGPNWINLAFQDADQAFNHTYAAPGSDRPVKLFINDYSFENDAAKTQRMIDEVNRLTAAGVQVDGIGSQAHLNQGMTVPAANVVAPLQKFAALKSADGAPMQTAITELDVPVGTTSTTALLTAQGYYYQDLFNAFRQFDAATGQLFSVTLWGLDDAQSWLGQAKAPLLFDGNLQDKPAYCGAIDQDNINPDGCTLGPLAQSANVFGTDATTGNISATTDGVNSSEWAKLPMQSIGNGVATFEPRWGADGLTVYVDVNDSSASSADVVTLTLAGTTYTVNRLTGAVTGAGATAAVVDKGSSYALVVKLPLPSDAKVGSSENFNVAIAGATTDPVTWSIGVDGVLTLLQPLSFMEIPEASCLPTIDGNADDPVWASAPAVTTSIVSSQTTATTPTIGTFKTLWSGDMLYVLATVPDATPDTSSSNWYEKDGVEIYIDRGNTKASAYSPDMTQIQINRDNVVTVNNGNADLMGTSAVVSTATGYTVEASFKMDGLGGAGTYQGLDFQVDDGTAGHRVSLTNWADPSDKGYQSGAQWGVGELMAATTSPLACVSNSTASVGTDKSAQTNGAARLADGTDAYTITATVKDASGAGLSGAASQLTVTTSDPSITVSSITDNGDGTYTIKATADKPVVGAVTVSLNGTKIANLPVNFIDAALENDSVLPGEEQTLVAAGFLPSETLTATLDGKSLDPSRITTDDDGYIWVDVPTDGLGTGTHTVVISGSVSGSVSATFTVPKAPTAPTGGGSGTQSGGATVPTGGGLVGGGPATGLLACLALLAMAGVALSLRKVHPNIARW